MSTDSPNTSEKKSTNLNLSEKMSDLSDILLDPESYTFIEHHWGCFNEWFNKYMIDVKHFLLGKNIDTLVDLGANTGSVAHILARATWQYTPKFPSKVICVEPNPENLPYLVSTLKGLKVLADEDQNKIQAPYSYDVEKKDMDICVIPFACFYSSEDTMTMSRIDNNRGGFFLSAVSETKKDDVICLGGEIRVYTLEHIMRLSEIDSIDLLKMDVEGAEWNIIENSPMIKSAVSNIIIEIHDKTVEEAASFFKVHLPMFEVFKINHEQFFLQRIKEK